MTDKSRFIKWLKDNNKLGVYTSMVDVWYNMHSILDNRYTAEAGILELENRYTSHILERSKIINKQRKSDKENDSQQAKNIRR